MVAKLWSLTTSLDSHFLSVKYYVYIDIKILTSNKICMSFFLLTLRKDPCTIESEVPNGKQGTVQSHEYGTWSRLPSVKGALVPITIQQKTGQFCCALPESASHPRSRTRTRPDFLSIWPLDSSMGNVIPHCSCLLLYL